MTTLEKISDLRKVISQYEIESFTGFFAYFIRRRPGDSNEIDLNAFDSKMKDFFYLIGLSAFGDSQGTTRCELHTINLAQLASKLNTIKGDYRVENWSDYTAEAVIHEMAFRNHFDNGVLSYVEQDLEKIRSVLSPFDRQIEEQFGFDTNFLIEIYKATELITKIRFDHIMKFSHAKEYQLIQDKLRAKQIKVTEAMASLPDDVREGWLTFMVNTYAYLLFTKEDLYPLFPPAKVDRFLEIFSCCVGKRIDFNYYTDINPLELAPILEVSKGKFLHICQKQIPVAIYRVLYDFLAKQNVVSDKVRRHREKNLEQKVKETFQSLFPATGTFLYQNYYVDDIHEQDLLILCKGTALIIETKASKLREPFRDIEKAVVRLKDDFKDCIQEGYNQCLRIEKCFRKGDKFTIRDKNKKSLYTIDPGKYHTVFSIVVTLERFGSLQTDLGLLLNKEESDPFPWSVYIDDLETFLQSLRYKQRNAHEKLIQFLRNRHLIHSRLYAIDELDICGSFLTDAVAFARRIKNDEDLLYFAPDLQRIFDDLYYLKAFKFKETIYLDIPAYFNVNPSLIPLL